MGQSRLFLNPMEILARELHEEWVREVLTLFFELFLVDRRPMLGSLAREMVAFLGVLMGSNLTNNIYIL